MVVAAAVEIVAAGAGMKTGNLEEGVGLEEPGPAVAVRNRWGGRSLFVEVGESLNLRLDIPLEWAAGSQFAEGTGTLAGSIVEPW